MKKTVVVCLLVVQITQPGYPAGERSPVGGRSLAMGNTCVANFDLWSVCNNQAGMAWLSGTIAGIACEDRFLLKELLHEQIGLSLVTNAGAFGLCLARFGDDRYNEIKAGLSYARKFGRHFSAGLQFDYFRIHVMNDYGSRNLASIEIGLMYLADKNLRIGVHIVNPVPVKITPDPPEQLPSVICIGLSYHFSNTFLTSLEVEKDIENPVAIRAGAEYQFSKAASARIGCSSGPVSFTFGFGLAFGKLKLDMASGYHQTLGFSPSGSITYSFR